MLGAAIANFASSAVQQWGETRKLKSEIKREQIKVRADQQRRRAEVDLEFRRGRNALLLKNAEADNNLDALQTQVNSKRRFDEFLVLVVLAPWAYAIYHAPPGASVAEIMSAMPAYYTAFTMLVIGAQLGLRGAVGALIGLKRGGGNAGRSVIPPVELRPVSPPANAEVSPRAGGAIQPTDGGDPPFGERGAVETAAPLTYTGERGAPSQSR